MYIPDSIREDIKAALLDDALTRKAAIEVFHRRGIILLWGEVESEEIACAAEQIARQKHGVLKVINDLAVNALEDDEFFLPGLKPKIGD